MRNTRENKDASLGRKEGFRGKLDLKLSTKKPQLSVEKRGKVNPKRKD